MFASSSSSSLTGCSPPSAKAEGGGTGGLLFLLVALVPALVGRSGKPDLSSLIVAAFSRLAPKGGRESLLLFPLTGGSFASPRPPSNRRSRYPGPPPLGVVAGFTFLTGTRRQFSGLASKEAAQRASSSTRFVSCLLSEAAAKAAVIVHRRGVLRARPCRAARRACFSSLQRRPALPDTFGTRPCPLPTKPGKAWLCSSAGCEALSRTQP